MTNAIIVLKNIPSAISQRSLSEGGAGAVTLSIGADDADSYGFSIMDDNSIAERW